MSFKKSVLFVAPTTNLFYAPKEAEAVVNSLGANLLNGNVDVSDLIERVRKVQPALLIISTHGSHDGILLSDGTIGAELLKPILSTAKIECVYLNTCESMETAMAIHNELPTAFVSAIQPVPDKLAYVTMMAFSHHLNQGCSYVDAWFRSKAAGNTNFLFLPSALGFNRIDESMNSSHQQTSQYTHSPLQTRDEEIEDLHEEVSRLSALIYGSKQWNNPGILPTLTKLERGLNQIRILLILVLVAAILLVAVLVSIDSQGLAAFNSCIARHSSIIETITSRVPGIAPARDLYNNIFD